MRITRNQLQDLINEEISRSLLKSQNRRLIESSESDMNRPLYDIDSSALIDFAEAYVALGGAVREQLKELLDMQEEASCNPNAVELMREELYGQNQEIDTAIDVWTDANSDNR